MFAPEGGKNMSESRKKKKAGKICLNPEKKNSHSRSNHSASSSISFLVKIKDRRVFNV